jgi:DNA-binding MarR family transcriptional regulator
LQVALERDAAYAWLAAVGFGTLLSSRGRLCSGVHLWWACDDGRHPLTIDLPGLLLSNTCVTQATECTRDDNELAGALYAVVLRLARLPVHEPVDKAGLAVLHETRRLGTVRPSDLAAQMHLDLSTISRHLHALEQQGMVQRTPDPADARAQRISLTADGCDVLTRVMDHRATAVRDAIAHWQESERRALRQLLRRLSDDLSHVTGPCPPRVASEPARILETTEKP